MVPMAPERGDAADHDPQRLSPEAAWGMRALIMVLMFLLRWVGREPAAAAIEAPVEDEQAPSSVGDAGRAARAERVAKGAIGPIGDAAGRHDPPVPPRDRVGVAAANRRRALYASALTAAGTAAWMAGRRSGRRG